MSLPPLPEPAFSFHGQRVLVVDNPDDLAEELRRTLAQSGAMVIGPVSNIGEALELLRAGPAPTFAILKVEVAGEPVWPVADLLHAMKIPYLFASD